MPVNAVIPETGATTKPGPMTTVVPALLITDDQLEHISGDSGLNGPFLADLLSAAVTHERMGINLCRVLQAQSANPTMLPMLKALMADTEVCIGLHESLITDLGGNPQYASPLARATEGMDSKLIESFLLIGSADPLAVEAAGVDALMLSATKCLANTALIQEAANAAKDGTVKRRLQQAVDELTPRQRQHLDTAVETQRAMVRTQLNHPVAQKAMNAIAGKVREVKEKLH